MRFIFLLLLISASALSQTSEMRKFQEKYIKQHVPPSNVFANYLQRDLELYFSDLLKQRDISLSYQMLRSSPAQSGSTHPKYFVWVEVSKQYKPVAHGALRVAAINQQGFRVMEFFSAAELRADPHILAIDYPYEVKESIKEMAFYQL